MTPERWQYVKSQLAAALDVDPQARPAYLDSVCAGDPALRNELETLLAAGTADAEVFATPVFAELSRPNAWLGRRIGPYQIVEEIGEGGMGEVYRAFRADDQYRKEVALKVVRGGQDSGFVISRFKNERQILASLDHPNIARLHDGGTTPEGTPYFVMELIEGQAIDLYCSQHELTVTQRLKLFLQVCSAVQYAHQRLIVHRDLKPSNILVTSDGTPKLLDFGIAKILDTDAVTGQVESTLTIFRALTPGYASPEQLRGEPITTESDVYSLGIVLFELLTGHHPYRKLNSTPQEIARAVCEVEVEKPSTAARRLETRSGHDLRDSHGVRAVREYPDRPPENLSKRLRGDLDTILLMALRKDPQRRYSSVQQFAEDIRRHLQSLPVIARRDTVGYRASKFAARHRAAVGAAIVVLVILLAAMTVTLRQARIAREQRAIAERRFNDVRDLANSLMFDVHDSIQDLPGSTPARKLLVDRARHYLDSLARDSASDPSLLQELATAYEKIGTVQGNPFGANLGDTQGALDSYSKAFAIRESLSQKNPGNVDDTVAMVRTLRLIAAVLGNRGDATSIPKLQRALASAEQAFKIAPSNPAVLEELQASYYLLAVLLDAAGDYRSAAEYLQKELPIVEARAQASPGDRLLRREFGRAEVKAGYALAKACCETPILQFGG
jgi:non-specific serine/threonine protein kinase/serine/threonine-protein kinase